MAANRTQPTGASVSEFLNGIDNETRRRDACVLDEILAVASGETGTMWGTSIVGYGLNHLPGSGGRGTDWMLVGFSPRKANLVIYFTTDHDPALLDRLGKHKRGVGCVYIAKLAHVDLGVLHDLIVASVARARG